ncbi:hypothetical protein AB0953_21075 [Streptomyces sp. NPDC046866]|uniref:hypothetical protein n=1 Tax=Streptomyces sp. NPDC046866 TaxID=3154921 RepID=UPI0034554CCF
MRGASGSGQAARTPFVLLVVALLAGGLISLLLLNSALNQGSFQLARLKKETTALTDEEQALQRDVDAYSQPDALQRRAQELGMVPGGSPVFIGPDGQVSGSAVAAEAPVAAPSPSPSASASAPAALPSPAGPPAVVPPSGAAAPPANAPGADRSGPGGAPLPSPAPGR